MKEVIYNNKKIYIFGNSRDYKKIVVVSQGSSENYTSSFMVYFINELVKSGCLVFTYDYNFFIKKRSVSDQFKNEIFELDNVLKYIKEKYQEQKVILMGKSLGGVLSLAYQAKNNDQDIEKIYILGLPIILGFPIRLELLKTENLVLPNFFNEYRNMIEKIKTDITVVQGTNDDLYDKDSAEKLFKNIKYIDGANHNFFDFKTEKDYYKECYSSFDL